MPTKQGDLALLNDSVPVGVCSNGQWMKARWSWLSIFPRLVWGMLCRMVIHGHGSRLLESRQKLMG